jgi:hypothetical protein
MTSMQSSRRLVPTLLLALLVCGTRAAPAVAQGPGQRHSTEWAGITGGATDLSGGARGGSFWAVQLRWGKVLTAPHGPGPLRGTLEYAFEIVPAMLLRQDGAVYGGGFNPFFWQYNFTSHRRVIPYLQVGGGTLWTSRDFPAGTSSFNFTPQGGIGAYWVRTERSAVAFGVRYDHISNAGITKPNPGHNALYFYGGFSWWR